MSLELSLLPYLNSGLGGNDSHAIIPCNYADANLVWEARNSFPQTNVDDDFHSYCSRNAEFEEPHYGETLETPYGERLTWAYARDLKLLLGDTPAGAYVRCLADLHQVALLWH